MTALICFAVAKGLVLRTARRLQAAGQSRSGSYGLGRGHRFRGRRWPAESDVFEEFMPIASGPAEPHGARICGGPEHSIGFEPDVPISISGIRLFCTTSEVDVLFVRPTVLLASAGSGWRALAQCPAIPASVGLRTDSARHRCTIPVAEPLVRSWRSATSLGQTPACTPLPGSCLWATPLHDSARLAGATECLAASGRLAGNRQAKRLNQRIFALLHCVH